MEKQGGMAFGLGKTATAVIKPERYMDIPKRTKLKLSFVFFFL
jgi:hypothetical protein